MYMPVSPHSCCFMRIYIISLSRQKEKKEWGLREQLSSIRVLIEAYKSRIEDLARNKPAPFNPSEILSCVLELAVSPFYHYGMNWQGFAHLERHHAWLPCLRSGMILTSPLVSQICPSGHMRTHFARSRQCPLDITMRFGRIPDVP